jgi:hypothetical protein
MNRLVAGLTLMGVLLLTAPFSHADIIFSDLGPGGTFNPNVGYSLGGDNQISPDFVAAAAFTPTANFMLTEINIALVYGEVGPNFGTSVELEGSLNGSPDQYPLEIWYPGALPTQGSNSLGPADMLKAVGSPLELTKGTEYWLVATAYVPPSDDLWAKNTVGTVGLVADQQIGPGSPTPWSVGPPGVAPAFAVFGTPVNPPSVPEPGSLALLMGGLIGLATLRLRKRA